MGRASSEALGAKPGVGCGAPAPVLPGSFDGAPNSPGRFLSSPLIRGAVLAASLALVYAIVVNAWLCDDAFITFRSVDNLLQGRGLTWNPGVRVQVFTHPLWLAVVGATAAVTGELPLSTMAVSIVISLAAALIAAAGLGRRRPLGALVFLLLVLGSKAVIDFATSGLEGPLAYVLTAALVSWQLGLDRERADLRRGEFPVVTLMASLLVLTRPDLLLLAAPLVLRALLASPRPWGHRLLLATVAAGPLIAWELFSLFYFGSLVPNTAFAKLGTGIPFSALWSQGLAYLWNSVRWDTMTVAVLVAGTGMALVSGGRRARSAACGLVLVTAYTVSIGGDFMSGRFLAVPCLAASILLADQMRNWAQTAVAVALAALAIFAAPYSPLKTTPRYSGPSPDPHGIVDERGAYFAKLGLHAALGAARYPDHPFRDQGEAIAGSPAPVHVVPVVGMVAYFAGPDKTIVDPLALTDPLLARLPVRDPGGGWRVGHYPRNLPCGYLESLASGENLIQDPDLAGYYEDLRLVVSGPLLSSRRFARLASIAWGSDPRVKRYIQRAAPAVRFEDTLFHGWSPGARVPGCPGAESRTAE